MSTPQTTPPSTRSVLKSAIQGTGLYSLPLIGQRISSLLLLPVITRVLTTTDYGMLSLLEQVTSVLTVLFGGNFSGALGYFYFEEESETNRHQVAGTGVIGALLLGMIASLACWPLMHPLAQHVFQSLDATGYLRIVFISMPLLFLVEALFTWLRVTNRPVVFAVGSLLRIAATFAGVLVLVAALGMRVYGYLYTFLGALAVTALYLVVYAAGQFRPALQFRLFLRMLRFAAPLGLSWVAMFIINFGDQFVLRHYRSLAEVGVYALAYKIGMMVSVVYMAYHSYWSAQIFAIMRRDDADKVFARLFTYAIFGLLLCSLALIEGARPALILVGKDFRTAAPLIPLIVAAYFVRSIGEFVRCLFLVVNKPAYEAICNWLGCLVCAAGYYVLIPRYGMWGAAIATDAGFGAVAVVSLVWCYRVCRYRVEALRLVKLAIAGTISLVPYFLIPVSSRLGQACWSALLLGAFLAALWFLRFPTAGEKQTLREAFDRYVVRR